MAQDYLLTTLPGPLSRFGVIKFFLSGLGFGSPSELTIAGGVITISSATSVENNFRYHSVDTQDDDPSDDLDSISGGSVGDILILEAAHNDRTIVVKSGAGFRMRVDFNMNHTSDKIVLFCSSSGVWDQLTRSSNAD